MIRRPPRSTLDRSSAASDVYKRQIYTISRVSGSGIITINAFQNSSAGDMDIIVSKYQDPATVGGAGTRVWQSYFGGSDYDLSLIHISEPTRPY